MGSRVDLVAVCARSERTVDALGGRFRAATALLADVDLSRVDAVVVSTPTASIPDIVRELAVRGGAHLTVMLDTPVLDPANLGATATFRRFRAVLASEDNFTLPLFVLARRLLDEGRVGRLRKAWLFHSGYRHHALAALRRLAGARARRVSVDRSNRWCAELHVRLPGGVRAVVIEPRRYEIGRTLVAGASGFLADYALDHRKAIRIGYRVEGDRYRGLSVDGVPVGTTELDEAFCSALEGAPLEDPSLMSQMKIRGLMDLLAGLRDPASGDRYPAVDAIEDNLTTHFAERLRVAPARGSILRAAGRAAGPFVRSGGEET
jgi:hypothetical protein